MEARPLDLSDLAPDACEALAALLVEHVVVDPGTGCHLWTGGACHGYGVLYWRGRHYRVHRLAVALDRGTLAPGELVRHRCPGGPNTLCCNPAHLAAGTSADNARDRHDDGHDARGERHGNARLTERDVRELRRLRAEPGWTFKRLGSRFGIGASTASVIVRRQRWAHVARRSSAGTPTARAA